MRTQISSYIIQSLAKPASYTAPGGVAVPIEAIVRDISAKLRIGRAAMMTHQAEASVHSSVNPKKTGVITRDGVEYIITGINPSPVPGMLNLGLRRVGRIGTENAFPGYAELVLGALASESTVVIGGQSVAAQVNYSTDQHDEAGLPIEDVILVLGVSIDVASGIRNGDTITVDHEEYQVQSVDRDGRGMAKVYLR